MSDVLLYDTITDPDVRAFVNDCEHDQNADDPDLSPCTRCGLLVEYKPGGGRFGRGIFKPNRYVISEELELP